MSIYIVSINVLYIVLYLLAFKLFLGMYDSECTMAGTHMNVFLVLIFVHVGVTGFCIMCA